MPESYSETPFLTARFDAALQYANAHHALQLRKGTPVPYVSHLLGVASLVLEMHGSEDEAIGALLHDVVEDGGGSTALDHIRTTWGAAVADIVLANSDVVDEEEPREGGRAWYDRKRTYVDSFPAKSPASLRVSLADKLHNARATLLDYRTLGDEVWTRFSQKQGLATRVYYRELANAFEREEHRIGEHAAPFVGEFRRVVDAITALAETHQGPDTRAFFDDGAPADRA